MTGKPRVRALRVKTKASSPACTARPAAAGPKTARNDPCQERLKQPLFLFFLLSSSPSPRELFYGAWGAVTVLFYDGPHRFFVMAVHPA